MWQHMNVKADSVTARSVLGEFCVLPKHTMFLTHLEMGLITLHTSKGTEVYAHHAGILKVTEAGAVHIIVPHAISSTAIDINKTQEELDRLTSSEQSGHDEHISWAKLCIQAGNDALST